MTTHEGKEQFHREVFPAELEEIRKRRARLGLPDLPPGERPSTALGLVGLALSGGGIRSASFSFGVIQALAKHGVLKTVDYLSTVSGGGFIGSCLSSVLNGKDVGPEQERFPLRYEVGREESLTVGQLRNSGSYLAPGGLLDRLRIAALVLRGALNNLLIFLLPIFLAVLATEIIYQVVRYLQLPFGHVVLTLLAVLLLFVIGYPAIARLLRNGSTWRQRSALEGAFTLVMIIALFALFLVPVFILVDQAVDQSWHGVRESVGWNLLRPFAGRNIVQWLVIFAALFLLMVAGRASKHASRLGGKVVLLVLGLLGPLLLGTIYMVLVVLHIDSPYIAPRAIFEMQDELSAGLDDGEIRPELRQAFADHQIRLSTRAEVINLEEDRRWLIRDSETSYSLVKKLNELAVYPDFQDALARGRVPHELITSMEKKGYTLDRVSPATPELRDNQFVITNSIRYWINQDATDGTWSLEQVVSPALLVHVLQTASHGLGISDAQSTILSEGVALTDDDREMAIRFVEEGNPHDIVVVVDNSVPPYANPEEFRVVFEEAMIEALEDVRAEVWMAVEWFDADVRNAGGFMPLTPDNKRALIRRLYGDGDDEAPALDLEGRFSNSPAALVRALRDLVEEGRPGVRRSILFISDGVIDLDGRGHDQELEDWLRTRFVAQANAAAVSIYGIALSDDAKFGLFDALSRDTGGAFYPVFDSRQGVTLEDITGPMRKLQEAAGGRLATPLTSVTIADQDADAEYTLTRLATGIHVRLNLRRNALSTSDMVAVNERVRDVFRAHGVDLSEAASIEPLREGRWVVSDPYSYRISRSGGKLKITAEEEEGETGLRGLVRALTPASLRGDSADWIFIGILLVLVTYWLVVDVNITAAHRFYRDRLSKAYLFSVGKDGDVVHADEQKLSTLNSEGSAAPYHIINAGLNLQAAKAPDLRGRQSDFFFFAKRYTGSTRTGFLQTEQMESFDKDLDLGTAMAISAAAAAPNRGTTTVKWLVFIMTLLNIRLGYWLPNPRIGNDPSWLDKLKLRRGPGPKYVMKEALGRIDERADFINVSDGGHIENLGIYELLRRRCSVIVAVDGGADPGMSFDSLVKLQLYARLDMGIEIEIDLGPVRKGDDGLSQRRWICGKIVYGPGEIGHLLYIKASVTGQEVEYVRAYRALHPAFPHESTADQFFSETQFEAYRALGYQIGDEAVTDPDGWASPSTGRTPDPAARDLTS